MHSKTKIDKQIKKSEDQFNEFVKSCRCSSVEWKLTKNAEPSPFALVFAIFCMNLTGELQNHQYDGAELALQLRKNLISYKKQRELVEDLKRDKPFLQLLTFTLSSLFILDKLKEDPLEEFVLPFISKDVHADLESIQALEGKPQSGNQAMFMAIMLIHARDYLNISTQDKIDAWVENHLFFMNQYGFWGKSSGMTHLQFQNGYHQYEILEFLGVDNPKADSAATAVASLVDGYGHYAPYPGGGGCYDYDAVSILSGSKQFIENNRSVLLKTANTILGEQNDDGGFPESHSIRPRTIDNCRLAFNHVACAKKDARLERFKYCSRILLLSKHNRIKTHWSNYARTWGESDLWDSWFRLMTIARIQIAITPEAINQWRFIDYPGIGYHPRIKFIKR